MKIKEILENLTEENQLNESLETVKFFYKNWKNDKHPKVMVLDYKYPGMPHQKTYGQRQDLLGWNVNYFENKEDAVRSINDIDTFARMLSNNLEEKYRRIKYFFPEQSQYLRRYKRDAIKGLKVKKGWFWRLTSFDDAEKKNDESF